MSEENEGTRDTIEFLKDRAVEDARPEDADRPPRRKPSEKTFEERQATVERAAAEADDLQAEIARAQAEEGPGAPEEWPEDRVAGPDTSVPQGDGEDMIAALWEHAAGERSEHEIPETLRISEDTAARAANVAIELNVRTDEELVRALLDRIQGGGGHIDRMAATLADMGRALEENTQVLSESMTELGERIESVRGSGGKS